jgi:membrane protease YdiL (CAAX protease family)
MKDSSMEQARSPAWQKALPFLALLPAAIVPNGSLLSLPIVLLTLAFVKPSRRPTLALSDARWMRNVLIGVAGGVVLWFLSDRVWEPLLQQWLGPIKLDSFAAVRGNLVNYLLLLAAGFIFGGGIEEIIFRGFVIGWGSALFGQRSVVPLVALSSIVFGLAHLYQGAAGAMSTGLIGLGFALLYVGTGRKLLAPMLAHMTLDGIGITQLYLGVNG